MGSTFRRLSNDLQACIDTGNPEEARLVMKIAGEALENGDLNLPQMAELQQDYDSAFSN